MSTEAEDQPVRVKPEGKRGGRWIQFGDELYRMPPVGFGELSSPDFQADIEKLREIKGMPTPEQMACSIRFIHAALVRNYPAITAEEVRAMVDLGNVIDVLGAALGESGFTVAGGRASGEAMSSTGAPSTPP